MKRVRPDPEFVYAAVPQPQFPILDFPADILALIFQRLRFKDVGSLLETSAHFYKTISRNEVVWSALFQKHFPNLPRFEPMLSFRTECELQRRCARNIIAGVHSFHTIPIGQSVSSPKVSCFALDEAGNIVIGYANGSITIHNSKGKTELLCIGGTSPHFKDSIQFLICEQDLYITSSHWEVKVWDAKTKKMTWSFVEKDDLSHIEHVKFVKGKLLVSSAHGFGVSAETTIRIWDLKSTNEPIVLSLDACPSDITLCGKNFVGSFEFGGIQVIDLESQAHDTQFLRSAPSWVYPLTEKVLLLCDKNWGKIWTYSLDDPKNPSEIYLWVDPGIPKGFMGEHVSDRLRCSLEELSLFFHAFVSEEFGHWDTYQRNKITRSIPQQVSYATPCVFHRGKMYYFCSNKEILCIDFTASHEAILQHLVQMLEGSDTNLYHARRIIGRLPKLVRDEIKKNYLESSPPPPLVPNKPKLLKRTQNFRDELPELPTAVKPRYTDKNCLRQAIVQYLKGNPK